MLIENQALRGAAESFSIVTNFYLAIKPAPTTITKWSFLFSDMFASAVKTANVFLNLQKFVLNSAVVDRKLTFRVWLDGDIFRVNGIYLGSIDTFNNKVYRFFLQVSGHETDLIDRSSPNSCEGFRLPRGSTSMRCLLIGFRI